ncbi:MAG: hypothetical protein U1F44_08555 [Coriobacteriia bacterium]|nr:hypothetical protein [Coriobacteriia bacterium]
MQRIIVVAFCIIVFISLSGCKRNNAPAAPEETTHSVNATATVIEPTSTAPSEESAPTGVYSPEPDGAIYTAIVQGAKEYLRVTSELTVHQLKTENGSAVMDVEVPPALTGSRTVLALVRKGDTWVVTFSADAFDGTPTFDPAWFPGMSAELLGSIEWQHARTTLEDLARTHAVATAASVGSFPRSVLETGTLRLTRTAAHEWWASCVVAHKTALVDAITVYMRWRPDGAGWETFDCGTGIEPEDDPRFPSDVAGQL